MNDFYLWFSTGLTHIVDWKAYDHLLFLFVLCSVYTISQWRTVLILITAFTIGHSVTLALSVFNIIKINSGLVEFLIPITIIFTCISNLYKLNKNWNLNYFMALLFGCIHGLGFSALLKSMLGRGTNILFPLLSFNIGLEAGQVILIFLIMLFSVVLTATIFKDQKQWNKYVSVIILIISFILSVERLSELIKN